MKERSPLILLIVVFAVILAVQLSIWIYNHHIEIGLMLGQEIVLDDFTQSEFIENVENCYQKSSESNAEIGGFPYVDGFQAIGERSLRAGEDVFFTRFSGLPDGVGSFSAKIGNGQVEFIADEACKAVEEIEFSLDYNLKDYTDFSRSTQLTFPVIEVEGTFMIEIEFNSIFDNNAYGEEVSSPKTMTLNFNDSEGNPRFERHKVRWLDIKVKGLGKIILGPIKIIP